MTALVKLPGEGPEIRELNISEGLLAPVCGILGGLMEHVTMPNIADTALLVRDDGRLTGLPPNFCFPEIEDVIVGPAVFLGIGWVVGECGFERDYVSLSREQIVLLTFFLVSNTSLEEVLAWK